MNPISVGGGRRAPLAAPVPGMNTGRRASDGGVPRRRAGRWRRCGSRVVAVTCRRPTNPSTARTGNCSCSTAHRHTDAVANQSTAGCRLRPLTPALPLTSGVARIWGRDIGVLGDGSPPAAFRGRAHGGQVGVLGADPPPRKLTAY